MDFLYKQMRGRLSNSGQEKEEDSSSTKDKRMQPQKTQSFKEKKRTPSWVQRQFSKQMSRDYSKDGEEYQAAVAAAAFAVISLEESRNKDRTRESRSRDRDLTKVQGNNTGREPEARTRSVKFPDQSPRTKSDVSDSRVPIRTQTIEEVPGKATGRAPSFKKTTTFADLLNDTTNTKPENAETGKAIEIAPSMKKASTFGDKNLDGVTGREPGTPAPKPDIPPSKQAVTQRQSSMKPRHYAEADEWEKAEMAKITQKYEKLNTTIQTWENKKKTKAKRQLDRIEAELVKRRAKATQHYNEKVARVDNIAGGAKAQAKQNQKNEVFKVKEKANKMRLTGKLPHTCLCF